MTNDDDLIQIDDEVYSHGDTRHYFSPKVIRKSEGSFLIDAKNKRYLDLQMCYSACNFGYGNHRINGAVARQLETLPQLAPHFLHEEKTRLAQKIVKANEQRLGVKGRVHFSVGGSQAIEDALKLIRNKTGRSLAFAFTGGYHGRTLGATNITSSYRYRKQFGHFSDRAHFVPYPYCFRCPYEKIVSSCELYCVDQFEKLFSNEYYSFTEPKSNSCEYSAFFIEPIQGTGGYAIPPAGYFSALKRILDRQGVLLVVDEIQMGFFRTGKLWSIEHFDVVPDVIVFGKSLTNGMSPLSGLWAKEELIAPDVFPPGSTHSTFSAHPLGTSAALEVMSLIEEEDFGEMVREKGSRFLQGLQLLKSKYRNIGDVSGLGLALRIEICEADGHSPSRALTEQIIKTGLEAQLVWQGQKFGLVLDVGGHYKNVLTLAPSLYITETETEMALSLLDQVFSHVFP